MIFDKNGNQINEAYSINGNSLLSAYDIEGVQIWNSTEVQFLDTAIISALSNVSTTGTKQGCCTDGEYIYQTAGDTSNYTYMQIIKYKISDGTYTIKRFDVTTS